MKYRKEKQNEEVYFRPLLISFIWFVSFLLAGEAKFQKDVRLLERAQQNERKYGLWQVGSIEFLGTVRG